VTDDPVNLVDPSGRDAIDCIAALVGFLLGYEALIDAIIGYGVALFWFFLIVGAFFPIVGAIFIALVIILTIVALIASLIEAGRGIIAACSG
jgi:hypothetical protein